MRACASAERTLTNGCSAQKEIPRVTALTALLALRGHAVQGQHLLPCTPADGDPVRDGMTHLIISGPVCARATLSQAFSASRSIRPRFSSSRPMRSAMHWTSACNREAARLRPQVPEDRALHHVKHSRQHRGPGGQLEAQRQHRLAQGTQGNNSSASSRTVSAMRRARQKGWTPRFLQLIPRSCSAWHCSQRSLGRLAAPATD